MREDKRGVTRNVSLETGELTCTLPHSVEDLCPQAQLPQNQDRGSATRQPARDTAASSESPAAMTTASDMLRQQEEWPWDGEDIGEQAAGLSSGPVSAKPVCHADQSKDQGWPWQNRGHTPGRME